MDKLIVLSRAEARELGLSKYFTGVPCKHGHSDERKTRCGTCVSCARASSAIAQKKRRATDVNYRASEVENQRKRYNSNAISRKKRLEASRRWQRKYPEKVNFRCAERRAAKNKATPPWLSPEQRAEILNLYELALSMFDKTGEKYHVDHIIPLNGELVSGLHVPWNLQVITASENCRKKNRLND